MMSFMPMSFHDRMVVLSVCVQVTMAYVFILTGMPFILIGQIILGEKLTTGEVLNALNRQALEKKYGKEGLKKMVAFYEAYLQGDDVNV